MSNDNINESYDKSKWIYISDKDTDYRYILGTVGDNPIFVVGINPSTAKPGELDNTMKSVSRIAEGNGFDSFIMLNVCAQRATDPNDMEKELNYTLHDENMNAIKQIFKNCKNPPVIWAAWGTLINKREYLANCLVDLVDLAYKYNARWCKVGNVSKDGHPHHPLYLRKDSKIEEFDIVDYISKVQNTKNSLSKKWKNDSLIFEPIANDNLVCKDCLFRFDNSEIYGNTSRCEIYPDRKPSEIIYGKACNEYIRER